MEYHNFMLTHYYKTDPVDFNETLDQCANWRQSSCGPWSDIVQLLHKMREDGKNILFEGAQGALLDIDLGTYPYVTSSNTTAGGTAVGSGFGPRYLDYVLGITKAYSTRVGSGPFPTELFDDVGKRLASRGHEFGSTTGRARRCGWFDAVALRQAVQINSISGLCITKLDVLDGLDTIRVCVDYQTPEGLQGVARFANEYYADIQPVYEEIPGWHDSTLGIRRYEDLPSRAKDYLRRIEEAVGVSIDIISTGPDREETIVLKNPFA
jgi:adenylosuccinate synthase